MLAGIVQLTPAVPLVLAVWLGLRGPRLPAALAAFLAVMALWTGAALTLVTSAFAGPGSSLTLLHGSALTLAIWASLALLSEAPPSARHLHRVWAALALGSLAALWSLAAMAVAQISAVRIAAKNPYCMLRHDDFSPADPRGFFFFSPVPAATKTARAGISTACCWSKRHLARPFSTGARGGCALSLLRNPQCLPPHCPWPAPPLSRTLAGPVATGILTKMKPQATGMGRGASDRPPAIPLQPEPHPPR